MILPLEQQVCSLESAKRLKELRCRQESVFYWCNFLPEDPYFLENYNPGNKHRSNIFSAYTVAELMIILPTDLCSSASDLGKFVCVYGDGRRPLPRNKWEDKKRAQRGYSVIAEDTEAEARAKMLIYLIENTLMEVS